MQNDIVAKSLYAERMKSAGLRNTHVRKRIFETLSTSQKPLSIKQLTCTIDDAHFVSIYRSIDALQKADIVKLVPRGFKNLYELSDTFRPHHHHASCERCGKSIVVTNPVLEKMLERITLEAGLIPTWHHFELHGYCKDCQKT